MTDMFRVTTSRGETYGFGQAKKTEYFESKEAVESFLFKTLGEFSETKGMDKWKIIQFRRASGIERSKQKLIQSVRVEQLIGDQWTPVGWEIIPPSFEFTYPK